MKNKFRRLLIEYNTNISVTLDDTFYYIHNQFKKYCLI